MCFKACSLTDCIDNWKNIGAPSQVLEWIVHGVPLTFVDSSPAFHLDNHKFTPAHTKFVDEELSRLLTSGAIAGSTTRPKCVSPLGVVPKKKNKLRLILDLRQLNSHCVVPKFRYEDISTALELVEPCDSFVTADLKNGFHHLSLRKCDQTYFGFCWKQKYYVWRVPPFGWKGSPFYFHKTVRVAITYLRGQGLRITSYVDDFLLLSDSSKINKDKDLFLTTLSSLGWQLNIEKCKLTPAYKAEYIGFVLDTTSQDGIPRLKVPYTRIRKVRKDMTRLLQSGYVSARRLAVVLGQCVSMARAILPAKLMLRNAYSLLAKRRDWDSKSLIVDPATRKDLRWWIDSLKTWNGIVLKHRPQATQISTDASGSGWGGHLHDLRLSAHGHWDHTMKQRASNYREIMAVYLSLRSFAPYIKGNAVTVLSDNVTTTAYLNHMGGPRHCMSLVAKAVWALAHKLDISLAVRYLPGKDNVIADTLSRLCDPYEWRLHPRVFNRINKAFGPHSIDRFASLQSTQLPRYNAVCHDPAAEAVDALAQDWSQDINYVNPPWRLLPRVLQLIKDQQATATVIAPRWPSQPWYHILQSMLVAIPIKVPNTHQAIHRLSGLPEPLKNRKWRIFAWKVCGKLDSSRKVAHQGWQRRCHSAGQSQPELLTTDSFNALRNFVSNEAAHFLQ